MSWKYDSERHSMAAKGHRKYIYGGKVKSVRTVRSHVGRTRVKSEVRFPYRQRFKRPEYDLNLRNIDFKKGVYEIGMVQLKDENEVRKLPIELKLYPVQHSRKYMVEIFVGQKTKLKGKIFNDKKAIIKYMKEDKGREHLKEMVNNYIGSTYKKESPYIYKFGRWVRQ